MEEIYKKYGLKYDLIWLLVDLDCDLESYDTITVNRIICNYYYHGDWEYFIKKQKRRDKIYIVLMHLKVMQKLFWDVKKIGESLSDESSSIDSMDAR